MLSACQDPTAVTEPDTHHGKRQVGVGKHLSVLRLCVLFAFALHLAKTQHQLHNLIRTMERDKLEWERIVHCLFLFFQLAKTQQQLQNFVRTMERDKLEWERIYLIACCMCLLSFHRLPRLSNNYKTLYALWKETNKDLFVLMLIGVCRSLVVLSA